MTITEDAITGYLSTMLKFSDPGDTMHHLLAVAADRDAGGPLGVIDDAKLSATMYAIAPDDTVDAETFVRQVVTGAAIEAYKAKQVIHFAILTIETYMVLGVEHDEVKANLARRLEADKKLQEHPDVAEVTLLYGAARDGRRWDGRRILTGPRAGHQDGPDVIVGGLQPDERDMTKRMIRELVRPR